MSKVSELQKRARAVSEDKNIQMALVGYCLHLSNYNGDYSGATQEAAHDLDLGQENEFKAALKVMVSM